MEELHEQVGPNREQRRRASRRSKRMVAVGSGAVLVAGVAGPGGLLTASVASADTFTVDSLTDDGTGTTLREAIEAANAAAGPDTITFAAGLSGTISLANDLPDITDTLSILGPGADVLTVDGGGTAGDADGRQIFYFDNVASGTNVVSGLTLTGGYLSGYGGAIGLDGGGSSLEVRDMVITGNEAELYGGGVSFNDSSGTLLISGSRITGNVAGSGGGGVYADMRAGESVTISNSVISGNEANSDGGGVYVQDATLLVEFSEISGNTAGEGGGGFYIHDSEATIESSSITGNTAVDGGGGLYVDNDLNYAFTMRNSTVSGNSSESYGGGFYFADVGQATIENSTISGNTANQAGAIWSYGYLSLIQTTITDNTATNGDSASVGGVQLGGASAVAGSSRANSAAKDGKKSGGGVSRAAAAGASEVEVIGTILAGNDGEDIGSYKGTAMANSTSSIIGTVGADVTVTDLGGTQSGVTDPGLEALASNGGPTQTHALKSASPALNAGPVPVPSFPGNEYDQRGPGYARVAFGVVDVGAFEAQEDEPIVPPPPPAAAPADEVLVTPTFTG